MKYLKTPQQLKESSENLNISDVISSFTDIKVGMIVKDFMNDKYKITNINHEVELTPKTFYGEPSYYPSDFNDDVSNFWGYFTLVE